MRFELCGVQIEIGFPFAAAVTLMLLLDRNKTVLPALLCCVLHEAGHLVCLFCFSSPPKAVVFGVFGMRIERETDKLDYRREAMCAAAGPAANFVCAAIAFLLSVHESGVRSFAALNMGVGIFNLLPVEPMDGSGVVKSLLLLYCDEEKTERTVNIMTAVLLLPLTVCGTALLLRSGGNFTLLAVSVYIALYLILKKRTAH